MTWHRIWLASTALFAALTLYALRDDLDRARIVGSVIVAAIGGVIVATGVHLVRIARAKAAITLPRLHESECDELAKAVVAAKLDRKRLLRDIPEGIIAVDTEGDARDQLLSDVRRLNDAQVRPGYDHPLVRWLTNAQIQASDAKRAEAELFKSYISTLGKRCEKGQRSPRAEDLEEMLAFGRTIGATPSIRTTPSVFLTYRSTAVEPSAGKDSVDPAIAQVHHELTKVLGKGVFFASKSLKPGELWFDKLQQHLSSASVLVAWLTDDFENSAWVGYEVGVAYGREARIVPVFVGSVVKAPEFITANQAITYRSPKQVAEEIAKLFKDEELIH